MNEVLQGLAFNNRVRFYISDTTNLVKEIQVKNDSYPNATAALGRSASISAMMGLMLKNDEKLTTIINGGGEIGQIITTANNSGEVRSMCSHPHVDYKSNKSNKLDVKGVVGTTGSLKVIKDLNLKEPFIGEVELISGEISQDYVYYFSVSEQTPTAISAGVLVNSNLSVESSGVLIIQLLPNCPEDIIANVEKVFTGLKPISTLVREASLEEILEMLFVKDYNILKKSNLEYKCSCNIQRFVDSIKLLGEEEIEDVKKKPTIECVCNFCRQKYEIDTGLL